MLAFVSTVPPPPRISTKTKIGASRPPCNKCVYFENGLCRLFTNKFATLDNYYLDANWCRLDEALCGQDANYFKHIDK